MLRGVSRGVQVQAARPKLPVEPGLRAPTRVPDQVKLRAYGEARHTAVLKVSDHTQNLQWGNARLESVEEMTRNERPGGAGFYDQGYPPKAS